MGNHTENKASILPKIIMAIVIIAIVGIVIYFGFGKKQDITVSNQNQSESTRDKMTAEDVVNKLKEKNVNIGKTVVYTEETDLNKLLGRPNQYTSKVQFADNRISQEFVEENEAKGGTVEVFNNKEDMQKRKEYTETISSSGGAMFVQYIYGKENVLLRLENELTPDQAKEYENAFNEIVK